MKKLIEISHVNRVFSIVGGEFQALKDNMAKFMREHQ